MVINPEEKVENILVIIMVILSPATGVLCDHSAKQWLTRQKLISRHTDSKYSFLFYSHYKFVFNFELQLPFILFSKLDDTFFGIRPEDPAPLDHAPFFPV